jgi:hypothetical protein
MRYAAKLSDAESERLAKELASLFHLKKNPNDHFRSPNGVVPVARMRRPLLIRAIDLPNGDWWCVQKANGNRNTIVKRAAHIRGRRLQQRVAGQGPA